MGRYPKDLLTITYNIAGNDVYIRRSSSPKTRYMGLRALTRKLGQLTVQVTEVPVLRQGVVRYVISNGDRRVWCVELPPGVYSITREIWNGVSRKLVRLQISLPWTYVIVRNIPGCLVYSRSTRAESIDDNLCKTPLPNVSGGNLCLGTNSFDSRATKGESRVDWTIRMLFDAPFVATGYQSDAQACRNSVQGIPKTLEEWATKTLETPNFAESLIWPDAVATIRNAMISQAGNLDIRDVFITTLLEEE